MNINDVVVYIDIKGVEHNALVAGFDVRVEGVIDLFYIDAVGGEHKVFAVHHVSSEAKQESNPELPSYQLNAYKLPGEGHNALPADHPVHDHPFAPKEFDQDGKEIQKSRPKFEASVKQHLKDAADSIGNALGDAFDSR